MKIGVIPESFRLPIREAIKKAAELGLEGIQPYATGGDIDPDSLTASGRQDLRHFVEGLGLEFSALWCDAGTGFADPKKTDSLVGRAKAVLDLAVELDTRIVATHVGVIPEDESQPGWRTLTQSLSEIGTYAMNKNCCLAIETGPEEARLLRKFLDHAGNPGLKVNLDPANLVMVSDDNAAQAVGTLAPYIVHTHAKDGRMDRDKYAAREDYWWQELPLGEGDVNFPEYLAAMKKIGYTGFFTIEREVGDDPVSDIVRARDLLRGWALREGL